MALGDPYATIAQLEARTGKLNDGTYADLLAAATRHVEDFTRRQFNKVTVATARKFRALDCERLAVDDFHTVTDLVVSTGGVPWLPTQFEVDPPDGVRDGVPGWPFESLFAVNRFWPLFDFRRKTITVTAQWGWAAVPKGIQEATLDVAVRMFVGGGELGVLSSRTVGPWTDSFTVAQDVEGSDIPRELRKAVPFRRVRFGVA